MKPPVVVIATGTANTASVQAAFVRCGYACEVTTDAEAVRDGGPVVLPGVGSFEAGMRALHDHGLADVVRDRVHAGRPLLAICLGLQLLCTRSEESPGVEGLGVLDTAVKRLPDGVRVPQFGWNMVEAGGTAIGDDGYAYYANSFCVPEAPEGWDAATTTYGNRFVAAVERGPVLACQFHPELSGAWGAALLRGWLARTEEALAC